MEKVNEEVSPVSSPIPLSSRYPFPSLWNLELGITKLETSEVKKKKKTSQHSKQKKV